MIKTLGLVFNEEKPAASKIALEIIAWMEARRVKVVTDPSACSEADVLVVLGGDGTLLRAARRFSPQGVPLLGVNLGRLGFLAEIELAALYPSLEKLVRGDYTLEERMMLQGTVVRQNGENFSAIALNDVVVSRGNISRIIALDVAVSGQSLFSYPADGIVISTPTGSTAYSLSAGGPVVSPLVKAMVISPVCPHTLSARPMVVDPLEVLDVKFARGIDCVVTFDGQEIIELSPGDYVRVERASIVTKLVKLSGRSFAELLRVKLKDNLHD